MAKTVYTVEYFYGSSYWEENFDDLSSAITFIENLPNRKSFNGTVFPFTQAKILKNNTYLRNIPWPV